MATPCAHKTSISALCDVLVTKKRNFALELDEGTICCVKFHPQNLEVDIPPYAVRWRRSEVVLRRVGDGDEVFDLEVRADAANRWRALGPKVSIAIIFLLVVLQSGKHANTQQEEAWPPGFDEAQGHYERITGSMPQRALDMTHVGFQNGYAGLRRLWLTVQGTRIQEIVPQIRWANT